jgi:replication factor C subunit 3/5|tara:strand:+ start:1091 stop:2026 length:936 start_codon:yes stop_codon:yes gene_type:complete
MNIFTPWVEKYRPNTFDDIVLDPLNKIILENIIKNEHFPNLLFYGPPGTGKTTSIINLIKAYQETSNDQNLMIHLNASDERGIDIIRNQINSFVNSKSLFNNGMKFVILDEVDYMTKNAQIALRYLLQSYKSNVRFCLICNYISRIDEALQNEFVRLRFNQLPEKEIINFLNIINEKEKLQYSDETIYLIQKLFNSDIRSMINYMQSNEQIIYNKKIIQTKLWEKITYDIKNKTLDENLQFISKLSIEYNIEKKNIIKNYLNYIIRNKKHIINSSFLSFVENVMHISELNIDYMLPYSILKLNKFLNDVNI